MTFLGFGARIWASIAIFTIAGCAVGPDYVRPELSVAKKWHAPLETGLKERGTARELLSTWWTALDDPELASLIGRALAGSLDLKKARAKVREARAQRGAAKGALFPSLDAAGSVTGNWMSNNGGIVNAATGQGGSSTLYQTGFDASWEVDIFGGLRRSLEAAEGDLQASVEDLRDVLVSLLAEVGTNYADVRTYQARLAVAEENLKSQEQTYLLTTWQYEAGLIDELAVQQARYNVETTRSQIPALNTGLESAMNRVAVLLGEQPGAIHAELKAPGPVPIIPLTAAVGIPADLLRRRPDLRRAERQLAAQTARVGAAMANLYPTLTLNGSIGIEALSWGGLFDSAIKTASGESQITAPLFHGGTLRQKVEVQSALQEQYLIAYDAALLTALEEVENALVAYVQEQRKRDVLRDGEAAAAKAAQLAEHKYLAGLTAFTDVLETQRSLLTFQDQLAQSDEAALTNLIKLYKALGGGWESLLPDTLMKGEGK